MKNMGMKSKSWCSNVTRRIPKMQLIQGEVLDRRVSHHTGVIVTSCYLARSYAYYDQSYGFIHLKKRQQSYWFLHCHGNTGEWHNVYFIRFLKRVLERLVMEKELNQLEISDELRRGWIVFDRKPQDPSDRKDVLDECWCFYSTALYIPGLGWSRQIKNVKKKKDFDHF